MFSPHLAAHLAKRQEEERNRGSARKVDENDPDVSFIKERIEAFVHEYGPMSDVIDTNASNFTAVHLENLSAEFQRYSVDVRRAVFHFGRAKTLEVRVSGVAIEMQEVAPPQGNNMLLCLTSAGGSEYAGPRPIDYFLSKYDRPKVHNSLESFTVRATGDLWTALQPSSTSEKKFKWSVELSEIPKQTRIPQIFTVVFTVPVTPFVAQARSDGTFSQPN